jgi:hypothetical protein
VTQWTGSLRVPEIAAEAPAKQGSRSKLPLVLGAIVILGGGGAAAFFATRGGGQTAPAAGSGSAVVVATGSGSAAVVEPAKPPEPPPVKLPDSVRISLDSTPHGATVTDLSIGKAIGKTPLHFSMHGSKTARQFSFHKDGYGDTIVELVPDQETIDHVEKLEKGAGTPGTVHVVKEPDATVKVGVGSGSAVVPIKPPDLAVTHPETGSAAKPPDKPPETGSAAKSPDDDTPTLKGFGSGH